MMTYLCGEMFEVFVAPVWAGKTETRWERGLSCPALWWVINYTLCNNRFVPYRIFDYIEDIRWRYISSFKSEVFRLKSEQSIVVTEAGREVLPSLVTEASLVRRACLTVLFLPWLDNNFTSVTADQTWEISSHCLRKTVWYALWERYLPSHYTTLGGYLV